MISRSLSPAWDLNDKSQQDITNITNLVRIIRSDYLKQFADRDIKGSVTMKSVQH